MHAIDAILWTGGLAACTIFALEMRALLRAARRGPPVVAVERATGRRLRVLRERRRDERRVAERRSGRSL